MSKYIKSIPKYKVSDDPKAREMIKKMYESTASIVQIARVLQVHRKTVSDILKDLKLK